MDKTPFEDFDFSSFWANNEYAQKYYIGTIPTDKQVEEIERELGYKLPQSYIALIKQCNGGEPINKCFPTQTPTSWANNHIAISGIMGIDKDKPYSLCGEMGSRFWIEEWGYPNIGIAICTTPSAGHDMIFLDYIMYMKNVMYKIIMGCYIVAALVLVTACNDNLDIQQAYPFSIETLPVPKKLKVGETAEIRCQLVRGGYYQPTTYQIRYFQPDGKGKLEMDNGTVFLPNDLYPLEKETFRLYYTSASTDQQTIDIYIIDSFGQMQQLTLSFNNDNSEEGTETITP